MTRSDGSTPLSWAIASGFALLSVGAAGPFAWLALGLGLLGLVALSAGLAVGSRRLVTAGGSGLVGGAMVAGALGAPGLATLVGVAAGVLAWDVGRTGLSLGRQFGREAETRRVEVVHVAASTAVGVATVVAATLGSRLAVGGRTESALVLLLVATLFLVVALRSYRTGQPDG